tara:strand:+ start:1177 stop:1599 length:423 start_codon:yes stop_codon:yes gene_type:complete
MLKKITNILFEKDSNKNSSLFKFVEISGWIYIFVGLLYFLFPQLPTSINIHPALDDNDSGWVRYFGFMGLAMGYYFVFMGRSQSYSLAVATVFSRVLFVPLALIFLILLKELDFRFITPVLITDFVLGFGTLYFILKEKF